MLPIRLIKIIATPINLLVITDRRYKFADKVVIDYHTNEGVIRVVGDKDFEVDGRSGGFIADILMPNVGKSGYRNAWGGHDIMFCLQDTKGVSFELANDLFRQALSLPKHKGGAGLSSFRAWLAWKAVESFFGRKAFETKDATDRRNKGKCHLDWSALT